MADERTGNETELVDCIVTGNLNRARELLQAGTQLTWTLPYFVPLMAKAIGIQNIETVKLLLDFGADVHNISSVGCPLQCAVRHPSVEMTKLLIARGACLGDCKKVFRSETGLVGLYSTASQFGNLEQLEFLETEFGPLDIDRYGRRFLDYALEKSRKWGTIAFFVTRGVKVPPAWWRIPDVAKFLHHFGVRSPEHEIDWSSFRYTTKAMSPDHPLWGCKEAFERAEAKDGKKYFRPATVDELAALSSVGADERVLDFYAHFMPEKRGLLSVFDNLDWLIRQRYPLSQFEKCGYFSFGSEGSGDMFVFPPLHEDPGGVLPVLLFSHELGYEDLPCQEIAKLSKMIAPSIAEFVVTLTKTEGGVY